MIPIDVVERGIDAEPFDEVGVGDVCAAEGYQIGAARFDGFGRHFARIPVVHHPRTCEALPQLDEVEAVELTRALRVPFDHVAVREAEAVELADERKEHALRIAVEHAPSWRDRRDADPGALGAGRTRASVTRAVSLMRSAAEPPYRSVRRLLPSRMN